ncbi:cysteine hydrolase [Verticiella sediminum]|uniref:Cysteine hydrolase n=1 Tax=Verticiella sediminum TaxID=1247510 RepID=A0A556A6I0_9BURK|nr:isochorismatase family cysteine hydrolase [Verticiella sediminum]TSH88501.1 cysteine hydrolase [Verticiella sediminum]
MQFPDWVVERVIARQGRLHPYPELDARHTAFVVVDLQNYYTQPGFQAECAAARATLPAVNRLAAALRAAGGHVVWVQTCADGADDFWSHHHGVMLTPERSRRRLRELAASHAGFQLHPGLDVQPQDARVVKRCYSALAPGSSNLHEVLRAKGVTSVLVGGTCTNVCCESTARDAMMMDYATIMVDDCLSALTPFEHEHALNNWMLFFGDVLDSGEVMGRLRAHAAPPSAARAL